MLMKNQNIAEVYDYVNHSLNFIEAKNGAVIALNSAIIMGLVSFHDKVKNDYSWIYLLAFVPAIISLALGLFSLYPIRSHKKRISLCKKKTDNEINLFRTESLKNLSYEQLKNSLIAEDDESTFLDKQKLNYILRTSVVSARKYCLFRYSLYAFSLYLIYIPFLSIIYFKCV